MVSVAKKKKGRIFTSRNILIFVAVAIPLFHFVFFWCQTNITFILQAFHVDDVYGNQVWSMHYFKYFFEQLRNPLTSIRESIINTLIAFGFDLFIQLPLCFIFSFFIYKKVMGYKFFRWVFFLPSILSAVVISGVVSTMVGVSGPVREWWNFFFHTKPLFLQDEKYAFKFLLFFNLWSGFGVNLLYITSALSRIPDEIVEACKLDGIKLWQEIVYVSIPMIWPTISTIFLLKFTGIWAAGVPTLLFECAEYGTQCMPYWIYVNTIDGSYNYVSAVGLILTVVSLPIVLFVRWLNNKKETSQY